MPRVTQIVNTLIILSKTVTKADLENINSNMIFNLVLPFAKEIEDELFLSWYSLKYVYAPSLEIIGSRVFE